MMGLLESFCSVVSRSIDLIGVISAVIIRLFLGFEMESSYQDSISIDREHHDQISGSGSWAIVNSSMIAI